MTVDLFADCLRVLLILVLIWEAIRFIRRKVDTWRWNRDCARKGFGFLIIRKAVPILSFDEVIIAIMIILFMCGGAGYGFYL